MYTYSAGGIAPMLSRVTCTLLRLLVCNYLVCYT